MKSLYDHVCIRTSRQVTRAYSTSFSLGIRFLAKEFRDPIYSIYGFVRFADEIVDTFHDYDKKQLLDDFRRDTYLAIEQRISLNPILQSFQDVVNRYGIDRELIDAFLFSMEMDLGKREYNQDEYEKYILGSAEVVGLMCLKVFVEGDNSKYEELRWYAMRLGSAFQKINFLRDMREDYVGLGRTYFPGVDISRWNEETKRRVEDDIEVDFRSGYEGILKLSRKARFGVYVAYIYYFSLFRKIKSMAPRNILDERVRIPNRRKYALFVTSYVRHSLNLI
ncbi:MAG: phytoene/squalene synthase family protein [Bacteroidia bacterium]|jgi:phytoene/squalene synthetase|nr:phytoene/squalene synthase family protein [Bacteroidia bacterium]